MPYVPPTSVKGFVQEMVIAMLAVVRDRPTPRSGAQQNARENCSKSWAVVIRLGDGDGVRLRSDARLQSVVYPCLGGRNDERNPEIVDASPVTTPSRVNVCGN